MLLAIPHRESTMAWQHSAAAARQTTQPSTSAQCAGRQTRLATQVHRRQRAASLGGGRGGRQPTAASAAADTSATAPPLDPAVATKTVLILGGSGRVGSSTVDAMMRLGIGSTLIVAGRRQEGMDAAISRRPALRDAQFRKCDIDDPQALMAALRGVDLVLHTAGPFQRKERCAVLEAAIAAGVPYIDVCDDVDYSQRAKALHDRAMAAGVPAITTAGIYPGVSNVMAAEMVAAARREYDEEGRRRPRPQGEGSDPTRILYSYFTAGTGGAGPTILETSLLLAGEDVIAFKDGERLTLPPVSNRRGADFGKGLGLRSVYLYNLPEVLSGHQVFGVPSISARFGTDPELWNWAMVLTARLFPKSFLNNRDAVRSFVRVLDPLVRPLDRLVGERMAMKVEAEFDDGTKGVSLYLHRKLSECVGNATSAFVYNTLAGGTAPGVWFPEEDGAVADRPLLLQMASEGCYRFSLNKSAWELDTEVVKIGLGFYI